MLGKNSRVPLLLATRDDLLTGAKINQRQAAKIADVRGVKTARKTRRAGRELERARFLEAVERELQTRGGRRVRDLPNKRQREIIDRAEVLARPVA